MCCLGRGSPEPSLPEPLGAVPEDVPKDACGPARGQLAPQIPGGFHCAMSWIFLFPPLLSHKASPSGHIKGHEERHAALASPQGALWSRGRQVNLWTLSFQVQQLRLAKDWLRPSFQKSRRKGKGATQHSPCLGLGCLLWLLAPCPGWWSRRQQELVEGLYVLPAGRGDPRDHRLLWEEERKKGWWAESLGSLAKATHTRSGQGGGLGYTRVWSHHPRCHTSP